MTATQLATRLQPWTLDPQHTLIEFSVKHMMMATVRGRFAHASGTIHFDPDDPTTARAEITIAADSVSTGIDARDEHLRSADFFDVEHHPTLTYRSTGLERLGPTTYRMLGDLTIRGVTRAVPLLVESTGIGRDPWGVERAGFSATAQVNRKDFGLVWNLALETGGLFVGDDVKIVIEAELLRSEG